MLWIYYKILIFFFNTKKERESRRRPTGRFNANGKKKQKEDKHCGTNGDVIIHPNQTPTSRRPFRQQRLQSLAKVREENINARGDFFGCVSSFVVSDGCVRSSDRKTFKMLTVSPENRHTRCLLCTHSSKKANLLLLMLAEASRSIDSLAATSCVNLLADHWRFQSGRNFVMWPVEALSEISQCQWHRGRDVDTLIKRRHQEELWMILLILFIIIIIIFNFFVMTLELSVVAPSLTSTTWLWWAVILHYASVVWDCQAVKMSDKDLKIISISNDSRVFLHAVFSDEGGNDDSGFFFFLRHCWRTCCIDETKRVPPCPCASDPVDNDVG